MMLGDWDVEDDFSNDISYIVFASFTFCVFLIMLNILIAIAGESFSWAKVRSFLIYVIDYNINKITNY